MAQYSSLYNKKQKRDLVIRMNHIIIIKRKIQKDLASGIIPLNYDSAAKILESIYAHIFMQRFR